MIAPKQVHRHRTDALMEESDIIKEGQRPQWWVVLACDPSSWKTQQDLILGWKEGGREKGRKRYNCAFKEYG